MFTQGLRHAREQLMKIDARQLKAHRTGIDHGEIKNVAGYFRELI